MASTHFKRHLIHSAMVQRNTPTASASGELIPSWADVGRINGRLVEQQERIAAEGVGFMMLKQNLYLCNAGEDVQEDDRVVNILWRTDDSVVDAGPFLVESLLKRSSTAAHHWSLKLERVE